MIRLRTAALALVPLALLAGCGSSSSGSGGGAASSGGSCAYPATSQPASKPVKAPPSTPDPKNPTSMTISTNFGDIPVTLEPDKAPCTVNSFVSLAQQGYFNNTNCSRVSTQGYYILQCGDPAGTGSGGPGYSFKDELVANDPRLQPCSGSGQSAECTYNSGVIAMANAGPDTNGSQFFLVYGNSQFPPAYTVFGHMDATGLKVVKGIGAKGVASAGLGPGDGPPKDTVTITGVQ
ncbi:MAG TPA: peptidylprolyl isomerase [Marmoricola sp.]|nr:peptidylprolyl isomerase [Marmoricola sp.]